jgi:hypothetical protein
MGNFESRDFNQRNNKIIFFFIKRGEKIIANFYISRT